MRVLHFILMIVTVSFLSCKDDTIHQVYQPNAEDGKDAVISEAYGNRNYSKLDKLHLLSLTVQDTIDNDSRFLLRIGFSNIPQEAIIDSAFIHLSAIEPGHFGKNNAFRVEVIKQAWRNDEVNWDNQPKTYNETHISVPATDDKLKNQKIDVTKFVSDVIKNKRPNMGLLFRLESEEKPYKGVRFYSSNTKEESKRPKLEVYYKL
ncbi:hypothetical protein GCM10009430_07280 [Aquimarina litoralis]|uniref:Carbohydrate-binding module family 96 domain-containing protein n=1 Tax=Aquimarina litoralis TaxID=584605 RepID=A0ABP3TP99_9FLAO